MRLDLFSICLPALAIACAIAAPTAAQTWPARPVRVIVPFAPGGGIVGAEFVAKAAPDGYTLLTSAPEFSVNPGVRSKLPYDPIGGFAYISQLTSGQFLLASHPSVPVTTVKQLVAL